MLLHLETFSFEKYIEVQLHIFIFSQMLFLTCLAAPPPPLRSLLAASTRTPSCSPCTTLWSGSRRTPPGSPCRGGGPPRPPSPSPPRGRTRTRLELTDRKRNKINFNFWMYGTYVWGWLRDRGFMQKCQGMGTGSEERTHVIRSERDSPCLR